MKIADVRKNAFAMPLNNPAYPRGPYKFYNREFVIITYRTDPELLRAVVPEIVVRLRLPLSAKQVIPGGVCNGVCGCVSRRCAETTTQC